MKILAIGDVTSPGGVDHLSKKLWSVREKFGIDFCVVNGENASVVSGISPTQAEELLRSGADAITGGNHTLQNFSSHGMLEESSEVLRPINYGSSVPGRGYSIIDIGSARVLVINAMGQTHIDPVLDSAYPYIDAVLRECEGKYDVSLLDFHAEATGEKLCMAYSYDGRINVIFGTHTHVPTADCTVLPKGTGYVTDLGMCGESRGILGMDISGVMRKVKARMPGKLKAADGEPFADGVIFELQGGKCISVKRIRF